MKSQIYILISMSFQFSLVYTLEYPPSFYVMIVNSTCCPVYVSLYFNK